MKNRQWISLLCLMLLMVGCGGTEQQAVPSMIQEMTVTPSPTSTPCPTPTNVPKEEQDELALLQKEMREAGAFCGTAYLGYVEGDFQHFMTYLQENKYLEKFPFVAELTEENVVLASGGEWYVIVPAEEGISFVVSDAVLDEETYMIVAGKERLRTESGEILLLRGNVSDIFPSFVITVIKDDNEVMEFSPSLSLRDGALNQYEGVYDFTAYDE